MTRPAARLLCGLALLAAAGPASGQGRNMQVTARIDAQCAIQADDLDFGEYGPAKGSVGSTEVRIRCTPDLPLLLSLDGGRSGDPGNRAMAGPGALKYQLYKDEARSQVFGDRTAADKARVLSTGLWQHITVYGVAPAGQDPPAGAYLDTIQATISY